MKAIDLKHYGQSAIDMRRITLINDLTTAHNIAVENYKGNPEEVKSVLASVKEF